MSPLARQIAHDIVLQHTDVLLGIPTEASFRDAEFAIDELAKIIDAHLPNPTRTHGLTQREPNF